jgi:hypothetical protein
MPERAGRAVAVCFARCRSSPAESRGVHDWASFAFSFTPRATPRRFARRGFHRGRPARPNLSRQEPQPIALHWQVGGMTMRAIGVGEAPADLLHNAEFAADVVGRAVTPVTVARAHVHPLAQYESGRRGQRARRTFVRSKRKPINGIASWQMVWCLKQHWGKRIGASGVQMAGELLPVKPSSSFRPLATAAGAIPDFALVF